MSLENIFSLAQISGYLSFLIGVYAYSRKDDLSLKLFSAMECCMGVVHFWLMGNPSASAALTVSLLRSLTAMRTSNTWVACFFIGATVVCGWFFAESWRAVLPIGGSCLVTAAVFLFKGENMRYVIMMGSSLWLLNNILIGSIGGFCMEVMIIGANAWTIVSLQKKRSAGNQNLFDVKKDNP